MTVQENKELVKRFFEDVVNEGQMELVDKLISRSYAEHEVPPGQDLPANGRDALKEMVREFRKGFPDLQVEVDRLVGEGDIVTAHTTWTGTHEGSFWGIEPTHETVRFTAVDMVAFEDGKAVEHWGLTDNLALFSQIGVIDLPQT